MRLLKLFKKNPEISRTEFEAVRARLLDTQNSIEAQGRMQRESYNEFETLKRLLKWDYRHSHVAGLASWLSGVALPSSVSIDLGKGIVRSVQTKASESKSFNLQESTIKKKPQRKKK